VTSPRRRPDDPLVLRPDGVYRFGTAVFAVLFFLPGTVAGVLSLADTDAPGAMLVVTAGFAAGLAWSVRHLGRPAAVLDGDTLWMTKAFGARPLSVVGVARLDRRQTLPGRKRRDTLALHDAGGATLARIDLLRFRRDDREALVQALHRRADR
jgi:hypothetical protein